MNRPGTISPDFPTRHEIGDARRKEADRAGPDHPSGDGCLACAPPARQPGAGLPATGETPRVPGMIKTVEAAIVPGGAVTLSGATPKT